jgi:hypothetical protein
MITPALTAFVVASTAAAAMAEARSEQFQTKLYSNWRKVQVDTARAHLRSKERQAMQGRGKLAAKNNERLRRMQATQREFFDELKRSSDKGDNAQQQELVDQALRAFTRYYELVQKEQRVTGLLASSNRREIEQDIARMEVQADSTSREAREQYLRAAEFRKQELRSLERTEQLAQLLHAHMDALESALATMRARLINISILDAYGVGNAYADLTKELLALERAYQEVTDYESTTIFEFEKL